MKFYNPFRYLTKFEWCLWSLSVAVVSLSFFLGDRTNPLSLAASLLGVTALIFVAKGDVTGQALTVVFSLLYAIVSYEQHYYGEMITYLCMSAPIAAFSVVSWLRHPYAADRNEVRMTHLSRRDFLFTFLLAGIVTVVFYFILKALGNAQIAVSTLSVTTSFLAAYLLFRRSPWYALAYAANDIVLIILWILASINNPSYLPMVACFLMFLCNDLYALTNWLHLRKGQRGEG